MTYFIFWVISVNPIDAAASRAAEAYGKVKA